jgi:hypothetical protein
MMKLSEVQVIDMQHILYTYNHTLRKSYVSQGELSDRNSIICPPTHIMQMTSVKSQQRQTGYKWLVVKTTNAYQVTSFYAMVNGTL